MIDASAEPNDAIEGVHIVAGGRGHGVSITGGDASLPADAGHGIITKGGISSLNGLAGAGIYAVGGADGGVDCNPAGPGAYFSAGPHNAANGASGLLLTGTFGQPDFNAGSILSAGLEIIQSEEDAAGVYILANGIGHGVQIVSVGGDGINVSSEATNGNGINSTGNGTGAGLLLTAGATGNGFLANGGSTSGNAFALATTGSGTVVVPT